MSGIPSLTSLNGRIIEIWTETDRTFLELMVGDQRVVLHQTDGVGMTSRGVPEPGEGEGEVEADEGEVEGEVGSIQPPSIHSLRRGDLVSVKHTPSQEILDLHRHGSSHGEWNSISDGMRWRRMTGKPSRMFLLRQRQEITRAIRDSLFEQDFLEVETPLWVKGTCPDTHIESISARDPASQVEGYLVTSTEYQIKRLMVGGFDRVFTLTKNFRAGDRGRYHSSEFTMLEWARAFGSMDEIEEDACHLIRRAFQRLYPQQTGLTYQGCDIDLMKEPWERLSIRQAFRKYLGLENLSDFSLETLSAASKAAGVDVPTHFLQDKHLVLSFLLDRLQPNLGRATPTFLREWPAYMTSSAKVSAQDPQIAERSELYIGGIEIADGFPFLREPETQRQCFSRERDRRREEGKLAVVIDERYIEALEEGIPPGAGMALGVDRLVMVLTGSSQLADVQAFSWDEL